MKIDRERSARMLPGTWALLADSIVPRSRVQSPIISSAAAPLERVTANSRALFRPGLRPRRRSGNSTNLGAIVKSMLNARGDYVPANSLTRWHDFPSAINLSYEAARARGFWRLLPGRAFRLVGVNLRHVAPAKIPAGIAVCSYNAR